MSVWGSQPLPFPNQGHIALVVRGKGRRDLPPGDGGHVDVILPSGAPAGFFVAPSFESAGASGTGGRNGTGISGMGAPGYVYGYADFCANRAHYVHMRLARAHNALSGVLLMSVSPAHATRFHRAWEAIRMRPGSFDIIGSNCASHAAIAFGMAGLIPAGIPGLDTPDNLFHALRNRHASNCRDVYGYLGFLPRISGQTAADQLGMECDVGMDAFLGTRRPAPPPSVRPVGGQGRLREL